SAVQPHNRSSVANRGGRPQGGTGGRPPRHPLGTGGGHREGTGGGSRGAPGGVGSVESVDSNEVGYIVKPGVRLAVAVRGQVGGRGGGGGGVGGRGGPPPPAPCRWGGCQGPAKPARAFGRPRTLLPAGPALRGRYAWACA